MKHEITNEQPFAWFLRVWQGRLINQLERERERTSECNVVSVRVKRGRNVPRRVSSPVSSKSLCLSWIQFSLPLSLSLVQFNSIVSPASFHRLDHQRFLFILRLCPKVSSEHPPRLSGRSMGGKRTGIPSPYAIKR